MKTTLHSLIGLSLAVLLPASAMAQKVSYDYDPTANLNQLKTYAFKDNTKSDNPLVDDRIAAAIAAQLEARGMTRDEVNPDAYVTARQTFETQKAISSYGPGFGSFYGGYGYGYGYGWGYGAGPGWYTDVVVKDVRVRTLTIDIADAADRDLMWRGVGVKAVHPTSKPSHVDKRINREVTKILSNFPR